MRFALVSLFALLSSTFAFAQRDTGVSIKRVSEGQIVRLERCGGTARLTRVQGVLMLQVRGANCANLRTNLGGWKLNGDGNGERWIDVRFDETVPGDKMVLIGSNSYIDSRGSDGNGDYLTVNVKAKATVLNLTRQTQTREIKLQHCNGSIQASIANGRVVVDVSNSGCSKFDIESNSGDRVKYEVKNIPEVSIEEGYSGNFTIPQRFYDRGLNGIVVRLVSPRLVEERILIQFAAY